MKDSGIKWIGEIPEDWEIRKVKDVFLRKKSEAKEDDPIVLSLARDGIKIRDILNNEGQLAESYYKYNPVEVGDFLINPMDLYSGANCNVSMVSGVISPAYVNLKAKNENSSRFFDYYFKTQYWSMALFAHGKGVSYENRWTLNNETLMNYSMPYPKPKEQQAIANFLDQKVSEIDHILEKTRESIEEYKKYKQSLITEAVTKGLNPDVEMKDSGIEWIGEIPKHWDISYLNQVFYQLKNKNKDMLEDNLLSLSYGNIIRRSINTSEGLLPENFNGYNIIDKGDIVLRLTDLQNDHTSLRVGLAKERGIITSAYITLRGTENINATYFYLYLHSFDIYKGFYGMGSGVRQGLTYSGIKYLKLLVPTEKEQKQIVDFLDNKCTEIDSLISQKEALLSELETYKKSLIYECVTGKREVD